MPMHRRRVYLERGSTRKARMESWLSLSIYLSAAILLLSLIGCLPELSSSILGWLLPDRPSHRVAAASPTEPSSAVTMFCETMIALAGAYLVVAVFIQSNTRQGPR